MNCKVRVEVSVFGCPCHMVHTLALIPWQWTHLFTIFSRLFLLQTRDGNGYPIPEYPTGFTRYKGGYGMNSSPVGMLMGTILYPSGRRVRVRVWTTHTRVPMGNLYPQQSCIEHNKLDPYRYIYSKKLINLFVVMLLIIVFLLFTYIWWFVIVFISYIY